MNKFLGIFIILIIIGLGAGLYWYEGQAEEGEVALRAENVGDGRSVRLFWNNPQREYTKIEVYQSTDEQNWGQTVANFNTPIPGELTSHTVENLSRKKRVYFTLVGVTESGQEVFLGQQSTTTYRISQNITVATQTKNGHPIIRVFDRSGKLVNQFNPYEVEFTNEITVELADFDGDGTDELVVAPKKGSAPVRVFRQNGELFAQLRPYGGAHQGGVSLAVPRFYNYAQHDSFIVVAPRSDAGSNPVRVYRLDTTRTENFVLQDEFIPFEEFNGGIRLASGDINGNGHDNLLLTPIGGPAEIRIYHLCTEDMPSCVESFGTQKISGVDPLDDRIFPYGRIEKQDLGIEVADLNGDSQEEIIIYPQAGRRALLKVYGCEVVKGYRCQPKEISAQQVYGDNFLGGINVNVIRGTQKPLIVVAPQATGGPHLKIFSLDNGLKNETELFAYAQSFNGGVISSSIRLEDGSSAFVTAPQTKGGPHIKVFGPTGAMLSEFFAMEQSLRQAISVR